MDAVWSDCDIFDIRKVCMKAPSTYIIMARLVNITGLEWAKYMKTPQFTDMESPKGGVLSMLQTTHIELEQKDCIFLLK